MTETVEAENTETTDDVNKKSQKSRFKEKWGSKVASHGYCMVPTILLHAQKRLHIGPAHFAVLIQILDHWWEAERKPFPSKKELALRLGISTRQVQRYLKELEDEGILERKDRYTDHRGRASNFYDLQGLVEKLTAIEPAFSDAKKQARQSRQEAGMPGFKQRKGPAAGA